MINPLDAEARELLAKALENIGCTTQAKEVLHVDPSDERPSHSAGIAAIRTALEMRDAERAEVERLRREIELAHLHSWTAITTQHKNAFPPHKRRRIEGDRPRL